jgi:hypothetical protein
VYLWLEDPNGNALPIHPSLQKAPKGDVVMDQPRCQFVPHALALREGQTLLAKNSSPIAHNYNYTSLNQEVNPSGNFLMPAGGKPVPIKNLRAVDKPILISCNIHPWMSASVRVFNHPYYAVTDADGKFEIKLAPAGNYRLKAWHQGSGWLGGAKGKNGQPIVVRAGADTDVGELKIGPKK